MLIPMFSFRDKVEKLYTIPLCFANAKSARSEMKQVLAGDVADFFCQALLVAEFNPETGEMFSVGEDVSAEFNILPVDPEESEVSDYEESPVPSEITETVS